MEKIKTGLDFFNSEIKTFRQNNTYPAEAINLVEDNQGKLVSISESWNSVLEKIATVFDLENETDLPYKLHQLTLEKIKKNLEEKILKEKNLCEL